MTATETPRLPFHRLAPGISWNRINVAARTPVGASPAPAEAAPAGGAS